MTLNNAKQNVLNFLNDDKFIEWRLSRSEELNYYWCRFIQENPERETDFTEAVSLFDLIKINDKRLSEAEQQEIYEKILKKAQTDTEKRKRIRLRTWWSWSAAAVSILVITSTILFLRNSIGRSPLEEKIVGQRLPDENICLISGEKVVSLNQNAEIKLSPEGNASITDSTENKRQISLTEGETNKLVVPFGKRSFLVLADGTKVWLNSGTELEFPTFFQENTREIRMQGEIYLEVAQSDKKPFIVHTAQMDVRVYGTSFNISAYEGDKEQSVVLVEGSVRVNKNNKSLELAPNEIARISEKKMGKETVDVSEHISWKGGILVFNKTPMSEVLNKVGRYYNVEFGNNADVKLNEKTCSEKLFLSNNLDSVMTSVSILSSTTYTRNNQIINISKKQ